MRLRVLSIGVGLLLAASAAYSQQQNITYVLDPVTDGIGDILTGTITTDGNLGVLQGDDILSFQFNYDLSAALTIDDHTPSIDVGTWGSSDPGTFLVAALENTPAGVIATPTALTSVGTENFWFVQSAATTHAYASFSNGSQWFGDIQGLEQTGTTVNAKPYTVATAPEIDPASVTSALTLLFGGLAVVRGRKRT